MLALAWASAHVCIAATLDPATTWGTFTSIAAALGSSTTSDTAFDFHRRKQG